MGLLAQALLLNAWLPDRKLCLQLLGFNTRIFHHFGELDQLRADPRTHLLGGAHHDFRTKIDSQILHSSRTLNVLDFLIEPVNDGLRDARRSDHAEPRFQL